MKFVNLIIGASFLAGAVATPAMADSISNPTIGGAGDVILYNADDANTFEDPNANLVDILKGDASNPMGNVELFATSESVGFAGGPTILSGDLNGVGIRLSSLTEEDWSNGGFAQQWFSDFLDVALNPFGQAQRSTFGDSNLYGSFVASGGRGIFSDPNISYVNQAEDGGVSIGLAGHLNAYTRIVEQIPGLTPFLNSNFQASEIVKVVYDNGPAQYLYSFSATNSGLTELGDGVSHSGNYEVSFPGNDPESVPEPATMVALLLVGVAGATTCKRTAVS